MKKLLAWSLVVTVSAVAVLIVTLSAIGFPKPPTLTTEEVPRLRWGYVTQNVDLIRAGMRSKSFRQWLPGDQGMLVGASRRVVDNRLHILSGAGDDAEFVAQLPRNVSGIWGDPDRDYLVMRWDEDGREQFQLYRWDPDAPEPVRLTDGQERAAFGAFEPDGERIAFTSTRRNGRDTDIYVADPMRPASERLVLETEGTWGVYDWSPTDDVLALQRIFSAVESHLYTLDLSDGTLTLRSDTTGTPVSHGSIRWTRDGGGLLYVSDRGSEFQQLRHLDLETGRERVLSGDIPWDVMGVQQSRDGSFLILAVNEDGRNRFYRYDVAADRTESLDLFESGMQSAVLHPERAVLAITQTDPLGVARVHTHDLETGETVLWIGEPAGEATVPAPRLVHYPTFDSVNGAPREIPAFVYPGVGDGPRPVVVNIHGGPESQARELPGGVWPLQRKGVSVVTPNVRGSSGYGKTYMSLDDGYLRENSVRDIGALLDWVEADPGLDASRVMVMGGSYGGYMVLASLVHFGDRIRCGVETVGISNFVTFLENTADYRRDLRRAEYGDERDPAMRRFLESISPLTHADRIVVPLQVVQGANDPRVPVSESRQLVERARAHGASVRYIEGENEGHGFRNPWNSIYAALAGLDMMHACLDLDRPAL